MRRDEPAWWYAPGDDRRTRALAPLGHLYGWIAERRYGRATPYRSRLGVICIGNFTAGGTGKTPLGLLVAAECIARGHSPVFLTRGYGGRASGPLRVIPGETTAAEAGDEPLLLARAAPTIVARNRAVGARFIEANVPGASLIIMDDGLQNGSLSKDLTIAVVDAKRGIGNGEIIPAGPLRAPIAFQLELTDAIVVNGPAGTQPEVPVRMRSVFDQLRQQFQGPVLAASVEASGDAGWLGERPVAAFAGIGNPARFFATLRGLGANVVTEKSFPDHHPFSDADARGLLLRATELSAMLVTTEKDMARLAGCRGPDCRALAAATRELPVRLTFDHRDLLRLQTLIDSAVRP